MLTTVAAFREAWEAHMFRSRLEAEGVPAFVIHEYHIGNAWHYSTALHGVKVQVHEEQSEEASAVRKSCGNGEFRSLLETQFGDIDDIRCPNCGSHDYWRRRTVPWATIAVTLTVLFGGIVPPIGWVYYCNQCGTKFKQPLCPLTSDRCASFLMAFALDFVFILALSLYFWMLATENLYLVVVSTAIIAGWLVRRWLPKSDGGED
jgi:DNA-directed RNA polymerase subunit RPC12/RpoP